MNNRYYAGFWLRVWATLIDALLLALLTLPLLMWFSPESLVAQTSVMLWWLNPEGPMPQPPLTLVSLIIKVILPVTIIILFWKYRSATPGKMLFGMSIVDAESERPPSTKQCILRYLGYMLSMLPLGVGLLWIALDKRKQAWHDKLAGTVVIRQP